MARPLLLVLNVSLLLPLLVDGIHAPYFAFFFFASCFCHTLPNPFPRFPYASYSVSPFLFVFSAGRRAVRRAQKHKGKMQHGLEQTEGGLQPSKRQSTVVYARVWQEECERFAGNISR